MTRPSRPPPSPPLRLALDAQVDPRFAAGLDLAQLRRLIQRALAAEGLRGALEISLVITDDEAIRRLNATYRGIDQPTDVLSFPLQTIEELRAPQPPTGAPAFVGPPDEVLRLGDIVVSFPRAEEQAADYGHSLARELAYLTLHGVLHLLGYDHEDEAERRVMRAKEEAALHGESNTERAGS